MNRLFVDHLTVLDFSYFDAKRGVVGESWIVDVELAGELNEEGMLFDFGDVKKRLKHALDAGMDHTLVLPTTLADLSINSSIDGRIDAEYRPKGQLLFRYQCPEEAIFLLDASAVTVATVRPLLEEQLNTLVPSNVQQVTLWLRTEQIPDAYYHYSHGLKKHGGDCQRLCHGHRSRLEIHRNGQRDKSLEHYWAQCFKDVYLASDDDALVSDDIHLKHFGYQAAQGRFDVWIPAKQCYSLSSDTTVELIAEHLVQQLAQQHPEDEWRVKAYEGVNKGAIAHYQPTKQN